MVAEKHRKIGNANFDKIVDEFDRIQILNVH